MPVSTVDDSARSLKAHRTDALARFRFIREGLPLLGVSDDALPVRRRYVLLVQELRLEMPDARRVTTVVVNGVIFAAVYRVILVPFLEVVVPPLA